MYSLRSTLARVSRNAVLAASACSLRGSVKRIAENWRAENFGDPVSQDQAKPPRSLLSTTLLATKKSGALVA